MMIGDYQKGCQQRVDGCLEALFVPPLPQLERLLLSGHQWSH